MTKRVVPVTDKHGYVDVASIAALLSESVFDLAEGQRLCLTKPLVLVVLRWDGELLDLFEFAAGAEVARLRTEKKANFQHYHIESADKSLQVVLKKEGFHAFGPQDSVYYVSCLRADAAPMAGRRVREARTGRWNGPSYTK